MLVLLQPRALLSTPLDPALTSAQLFFAITIEEPGSYFSSWCFEGFLSEDVKSAVGITIYRAVPRFQRITKTCGALLDTLENFPIDFSPSVRAAEYNAEVTRVKVEASSAWTVHEREDHGDHGARCR